MPRHVSKTTFGQELRIRWTKFSLIKLILLFRTFWLIGVKMGVMVGDKGGIFIMHLF